MLPFLLCVGTIMVAQALSEYLNHEEGPMHDYKLHLISNPEDANVDLVAVHGLDGHWKDSWTAKNGVFWLEDLLTRVLPKARVFSFGHDSRTRGGDKPLTQDISDHGKDLVRVLSEERHLTNSETRPIIFIGHSLGGLDIKSALLYSDMARVGHLERYKSIKISTGGVFFLATPHQGGEGVTVGQIVLWVCSSFSYTNRKLLEQIAPKSYWLQELQSRYNSISHEFDTTFFYETQETTTLIGKLLLVPKFSAVIQGARDAEDVSMFADHIPIAKLLGPGDPNFDRIMRRLQVLVRTIQGKVQRNWKYWIKIKAITVEFQGQFQGPELQNLTLLPTTKTGKLDEMETARSHDEFRVGLVVNRLQNRHFVGRKNAVFHINNTLQGNASNQDSMRAIVLYGTGGVGKTQLALQYAYLSHAQSKYDSVFWVEGNSYEAAVHSIQRCLEAIKTHYQSQIGPFGTNTRPILAQITEALNDAKAKGTGDSPTRGHSQQRGHLVEVFINWLSLNHNTLWLIIIDNVDDPESFDFREILPKTQPGAVIVTSRRSDLSVIWDAIEVPIMAEEEAIDLLNSTSKLNLQTGAQDWIDAGRLVNTLGCLPLAIVQAGSFIAVQQETKPIASYLDLLERYPSMVLGYRTAMGGWNYRNDTLLTTWEISFSALSKQMPKAALIL